MPNVPLRVAVASAHRLGVAAIAHKATGARPLRGRRCSDACLDCGVIIFLSAPSVRLSIAYMGTRVGTGSAHPPPTLYSFANAIKRKQLS